MKIHLRWLMVTLIALIMASAPVAAHPAAAQGTAGEDGIVGITKDEKAWDRELVPAEGRFPAAVAQGAGKVAGLVFFDSDGDGLRDPAEEGLPGVSVTLTAGAYTNSVTTAADGSYAFTGLVNGAYTVTQTDLPGYASSTDNLAQVSIAGGNSVTVDFGDTILLTLTGTIFEDLNGDGVRGLGEPVGANAVVELYRDLNSNGQRDLDEARYAYTISDALGNYRFGDLMPGNWMVTVQLNGGAGSAEEGILLISSQASGVERYLDIPVVPYFGQPASVAGTIWNDSDGDELVEDDEARFAGVNVYLYKDDNGNSAVDSGEMLAGKTLTDALGAYVIGGLSAGTYVLDVDEGTLPGDFVLSVDPSVLAFTLAAGEANTVNIGYYDPLAVAPLRVADWKRELKQVGRPRYTPAQIQGFILTVEAASNVFPEGSEVEDALLLPAKSQEARARKEHVALQLNIASSRLLPKTPVNLPDLTTATTVAAAVAEIEGLLWPPASQPHSEYQRARAIAHNLNHNKGLGYGLDGVAVLEMGTYKGANVTKKLAPKGDDVDQYMDQAIFLRRWSFKNLGPETQVFDPQIRVGVKRFDNGGVLEVMQVLPDGRELSLGFAVPDRWNKDVNAIYMFHLRDVATVDDMINAQLRLYVRDPDLDGGPKEHIRVDSVELVFRY